MAPPLLTDRGMLGTDRVRLGKSGEDLACRELRRRGYAILDRRYRTRAGEIDIIARHGDVLVFIEVKTRIGDRCGTALEAVTPAKQQQLVSMAEDYLARRRLPDTPCRFDVVAITVEPGGGRRVQIVPGAFDASR